eukprot:1574001-Alexandrium_andersonii.AAC.1
MDSRSRRVPHMQPMFGGFAMKCSGSRSFYIAPLLRRPRPRLPSASAQHRHWQPLRRCCGCRLLKNQGRLPLPTAPGLRPELAVLRLDGGREAALAKCIDSHT